MPALSLIRCGYLNQSIAELYGKTFVQLTSTLLIFFWRGTCSKRNHPEIPDSSIRGNRQVSREIDHYSLPAIIAAGYRVRSVRGTPKFRQWATQTLEQHPIKAGLWWTMNGWKPAHRSVSRAGLFWWDARTHPVIFAPVSGGCIYGWKRSSPWQRITNHPIKKQLFLQSIQNKLHFCFTGMTAAELYS